MQTAVHFAGMLDHLFHYSACFESQLSDLGGFMKQLSLVICGKASVGGCCTLRIMFTVKLKCGGSVMKRIEVKWTIPNSDFHVALQRKLIFFKVTCCLSLWLLRKLHLKPEHRKKKKKRKRYNYSDLWNSLGQMRKIAIGSPVNLYYFWVSVGT